MKKGIALAAVAGLATVASAQDFSYTVVAPATVDTRTATSFTVTVIASGPGTHIAGGSFAVDGTDDAGAVSGMSWAAAGWSSINTDNGYLGNADYDQVIFGQLILPDFGFPPDPGSVLPATVGTFTVSLTGGGANGTVLFQLADAGGDFALETFNDDDDSFARDGGAINYGGSTTRVIPAPASLALMGLGGLIAGRRRR